MKKIIVLMVVLLSILCTTAAVADEPLFVAQEGWKQGYINAQGEWVIEPRFNQAWPFTSAGYAAVVEDPETWAFTLIDRQGKTVTKLSEWCLADNEYSMDYGAKEIPNAVGNAFLLYNRKDINRYALFLAGSGKLIELDREFLGYELSPGAEQNEIYYNNYLRSRTNPSDFCLSGWNGRLILGFCYTDYQRGTNISIEANMTDAFIILDSEGNKLHDGIYRFPIKVTDSLEPVVDYSYQVTDTYMLAADAKNYNKHLIDCDGKIIVKNVDDIFFYSEDYTWVETLKAVYAENSGQALLPDGKKMPVDERVKEQAALNPCRMLMHDGWYYDTKGERIKWHGASEKYYMALSAFGRDGRAWIDRKPDIEWDNESEEEPEDISDYNVSTLIDTRGQIILQAVLNREQYDRYKYNPSAVPFEEGWECICTPFDGWLYGYVNPDGEMMFGGFPFDKAEPFSNGLAHVMFMDDRYELLDVYINREGKVVWAEHGKRDEVQHWLEEGIRFSPDNMTLEDATQALVGEWDDSEGDMAIFYEDGTCNLGRDRMMQWKLLENTAEMEDEDYSKFVLVYGENGQYEPLEEGSGLEFGSMDSFVTTYGEDWCFYSRKAPGYWERDGYYDLVPDENGKLDNMSETVSVLPEEAPNFKLTDKSLPEETAEKGVYAFRGSPYRQNASAGTVRDICVPEVLWEKDIGPAVKTEDIHWQPLIVEWSDEIRKSMTSLKPEKRENSTLTEVIAVGTDGKIWFADLKTGEETRAPIEDREEKLHGTATVLSGLPLIICPAEEGYICYDLTDGSQRTELDEVLHTRQGKDVIYQNGWLMMNSPQTDLVSIGLNVKQGQDGISGVDITGAYRTEYNHTKYSNVPASADGNNVYVSRDNDILRWDCMKDESVSIFEDCVYVSGKTAACIAVDKDSEDSTVLYAGCMEKTTHNECEIYSINADRMLTKWEQRIKLTKENALLGGIFASPVVGQEWLENIVYFTVAGYAFDEETPDNRNADSAVVAYWKRNGEKKWETPIKDRAVSSPVIVYTEDGIGYLIQFDKSGNMYVLDGFLGTVKYSLELGGEVTSCPAVYGNTLVVRCQKDGREVLCGIEIGLK